MSKLSSLMQFNFTDQGPRPVPAARNDLARSRQNLLATLLLMGINRIMVADGLPHLPGPPPAGGRERHQALSLLGGLGGGRGFIHDLHSYQRFRYPVRCYAQS